MTNGEPEIDPHGSDIARFYEHHKTKQHIDARTSEGFNKTYGIVHPMEQWASNRGVRLSPFYEREKELGAEFFEAAGWERPYWYGDERAAARGVRRPRSCRARPSGNRAGGRRSSTPSTSRCATGPGSSTSSAFVIFDVTGPGRLPPTSSGCASPRSTSRRARRSTRRS